MAVTDILIGEDENPIAHEGDKLLFETGWSLLELRTGTAPIVLVLKDQDGNPMPASPFVYTEVSRPGYIVCPPAVANGRLPVYAQGKGVATLTLRYDDPVNGRITKSFTLTVIS